jgi:hypothetical protein
VTVNVEVIDYPPVDRIKIVQGSDATPGRAVVECGTEWSLPIPRITVIKATTTQSNPNRTVWSGSWKNVRAINCRRSRFGNIHVVFEDSRWILREYKMEANYNARCSCGFVYTGTQRTIAELIEEISTACESRISIVAGANVPDFKPPARWAGKTCMEAMEDLLASTGCRMVYQPENGSYVVDLANSTQVPKFPHEVYRPPPKDTLKSVNFWTAPKLFEERESADAVIINESTGEAEAISAGEALDTVSSPSVGANAQTEFRLWSPSSSSEKLYVQHRVKSLLGDPANPRREQGRVIRGGVFEPFPVHQKIVGPAASITEQIELTSGGVVFVTDHPVLAASGSDIATTATLLTGHYKQGFPKGLQRDTITKNIVGGQSGTVDEFVEWIKPISSSEPDVSTTEYWGTLFTEVCEALIAKFTPFQGELARSITTPEFYSLAGSGQVGAVEYEFQTHRCNKRHHMRVALNFSPGGVGNIR